jgi:hypothetical protein
MTLVGARWNTSGGLEIYDIGTGNTLFGFNPGAPISSTPAELNVLHGVTAGTAKANSAAVLDANKQIDTIGLSAGAYIKGEKAVIQFPTFAAADVAKPFFIAPAVCKVIKADFCAVTKAGQAGVLTVEKLVPGTAPGSGAVCLNSSGLDINGMTNNTPLTIVSTGDSAATMAIGDVLCLKLQSGAATSLAGATLAITLQWA